MSQEAEVVTTPTVSQDEAVEAQVCDRRMQFGLIISRYTMWSYIPMIVALVIVWFIFRQYTQLLVFAFCLFAGAVTFGLYPVFHRRGHAKLGGRLVVDMFFLSVIASAVLLPEIVVVSVALFIMVSLLGNMMMSGSDSALVAGISIFLALACFIWTQIGDPLFLPLGETTGIIVAAVLLAAGMPMIILSLRSIIRGQEDLFRQARLANWEVEQRRAVEQEQREHLEQANEEVERRMTGEREQHRRLQEVLSQLQEVTDHLNTTSTEILVATTQQASGASEQSAAIAQTTTTVDELKTIAEQSVTRAQEVTGASQRTVEVSRAGRQVVQETISSMAQIKGRVEGIAENILTLSEQTQQIGEIITTVNDIAAQSNILALNASVEAARAGEYGKGFAVVAVEVRNLAEQSRQATAQVRAILSDIQKATNATVMATEEGTKGVDEGVQLTEKAGEAIAQLAGVIQESMQAATQLVAGGRQQSAGVDQVALAMQNINQATVQSLASTRQAEKAARDLNELACRLTEIVRQYRS
ncbi:MAG: hypothetical protein GY832_42520 [Chloroflexi bacterium]|nr:hypothetical protein [Chloroflexota bacterium]